MIQKNLKAKKAPGYDFIAGRILKNWQEKASSS
jgi:hypothetical protein